ncbi:MAG: hypothetical protein K1X51_03770 [Rhodospirillaceae bacterium]|nr:hypothetical protein [Rhodospirillaceae bacterium]
MKYVLALALMFGLGVSAHAATPATHSAVAAKSQVSGAIKAADAQAKDTKAKKKKKKKKASHA